MIKNFLQRDEEEANDYATVMDDDAVMIDVYRFIQSGEDKPGFSGSAKKAVKIYTEVGRIDPANDTYSRNSGNPGDTIINRFIGIIKGTNVRLGDEWFIQNEPQKYRVESFQIRKDKVEVDLILLV